MLAALAFAVAVALGAVGDWFLWQPYNGIVITFVAAGILVFAILFAVVRRTRPAGLVLAAAGIGLIAGQTFGPSRPPLLGSEGTLTVTLTEPRATTGTGLATCSMDESGTELSVSGDSNLRLDILPDDPSVPADIDQREFVGISVNVGDRWDQGPAPRTDRIALSVLVGQVAAGAPETRMTSDPSSTLDLQRSGSTGSLAFEGLVPDPRADGEPGAPIGLAGTMTWECGLTQGES